MFKFGVVCIHTQTHMCAQIYVHIHRGTLNGDSVNTIKIYLGK